MRKHDGATFFTFFVPLVRASSAEPAADGLLPVSDGDHAGASRRRADAARCAAAVPPVAREHRGRPRQVGRAAVCSLAAL